MNAERWEQIKALVQDALDRDPSVRDRWLAAACHSDPQLLAEVRTLVNAADATFGFLQSGVSSLVREVEPSETTERPSGRIVGHYELLERVGAGAMGEVYRARDLALGRNAALKLLPSTFDTDLKLTLLREAEASAKLQHPAIATFYDAGEADGETFIAMEFVEGRTLRERLQEGPLPPNDAVAMTCSLLEALAHAHAACLLHRDIKPENIIVVGTRSAKLLDFSIATALSDVAPPTRRSAPTVLRAHTSDGALVGTIGYLAPEQIAGDCLDARTDVFQVGTVLYEMLTGRGAFPGESSIARLAALMLRGPDLGALAAAGVPGRLVEVVRCALQREPKQRYASAAAFLRDLRDVADGHVTTALPALIAVFDLKNRSSTDRVDWLGSALADHLRTALAHGPAIRVIPRDKIVAELARLAQETGTVDPTVASLRLGCRWALTGEVEVSGSLLRADVEVVNVATADTVSVERVTGELTQLATVQDQLASAIGRVLSGGIVPARQPARATFEAQQCYTHARMLIERISKGSLEDARVLLEQAIEIDGQYADALAALAETHALGAIATTNSADYEVALTAANRALAVDPGHVRAHVWRGYVLAALGRTDDAAAAYGRAIELDSSDVEALYFAAGLKLMQPAACCPAEAVRLLQRAIECDPSRGLWWLALGTAHRCLDQSREAIYSFTRAQKLEDTPARFGTAGAAAYVADMLRRDGRLDDARRHARAGIDAAERSDHAYRDTFRAHALTVLGRVALDQGDRLAAEAAFNQVLAQARGRPRPRACGHFVVQALSGLARATGKSTYFDDARELFESRETYNFGTFYGALVGDTLFELALVAHSLGRIDDAHSLQMRAREAGLRRSLEPMR
jgi:serine/threonine protein kinase/tetratricopeptide (TPR) repeat protein